MKPFSRRSALAAAGTLILSGFSAASHAADEKPLRIIVTVPPGNGTDVAARVLAKEMVRSGSQPVLVENRPGGNGIIAVQAVLNSPADGNTILFGSNSVMGSNAVMLKAPGYNPITDFVPVGMVVQAYWVLVVASDAPYQTLEDLVKAARQKPGQLSSGDGTSSFQLSTSVFAKRAGIQINQVPYKGVSQAMQDLVGHNVNMVLADLSTALPLIQSGRVRAVASFGSKRFTQLADVPTLKERGFEQTPLHSWAGFFVRAGTPSADVKRLSALTEKAVQSQAYQKYVSDVMSEAVFMPPEQTTSFQRGQIEEFRKAMVLVGMEPQ